MPEAIIIMASSDMDRVYSRESVMNLFIGNLPSGATEDDLCAMLRLPSE
jgi:hypothetical protein